MQLHQLMVRQPDLGNRQYALLLDMSIRWVYKWKRRIKANSHPGFDKYLSESRAPKNCWRETCDRVKDVIEEL
jgi:hypothetical protein